MDHWPFPRSGGDHSEERGSGSGAIGTRVMVAAVVVLFVVVLFIVFLHVYARCFWSARLRTRLRTRSRDWSRRLRRRASRLRYLAEITPEQQAGQHQQQQLVDRGLDKSVLEALPVFLYTKTSGDGKQGGEQFLDCAVCLSEFEEKEACRMLTVCNHVFHTECIDMWFSSHSTCPLCRCSVGQEKATTEVPTLVQDSSFQHADPASSTAIAIQILQDEGSVLLNPQQQQQLDSGAAATSTTSNVGNPVNSLSTDLEPRSFSRKQQQLVIAVPPRTGMASSQVPSPSPSDGQRSPLSAHLRYIGRLLSRDYSRTPTEDARFEQNSPAFHC